MKHIRLALIAFALMAAPVAALADDSGGPAPSTPPGMAIMQQAREKVDQLQAQARASMLGALSSAHRSLLAQLVGQLAVAPSPDMASAAKQLDANLTPAEAKSVIDISTSSEQQVQQVMQDARSQMQASMPQGGPGQGRYGGMRGMYAMGGGGQPPTDPGMILLAMAGRTLTSGTITTMQMSGGPGPGVPH